MNAKLVRILLAAVAGACGSVAASGEASPEVANALTIAVTLIGTLAPIFLRSKAGR